MSKSKAQKDREEQERLQKVIDFINCNPGFTNKEISERTNIGDMYVRRALEKALQNDWVEMHEVRLNQRGSQSKLYSLTASGRLESQTDSRKPRQFPKYFTSVIPLRKNPDLRI
jgi:predicted ArsR family transcriptional regulator